MSRACETYIEVQIVPMEWEALMFEEKTIKETERALGTDIEVGLTQREAKRRLSEGTNELIGEEKKTFFGMFMEQLADPLIYVLMGAGVISAFLGEWQDAGIILLVILLNAFVGCVQEGKAAKALEVLRKMTSPVAFVKREGQLCEIMARDLVPGDLVVLEAGMQVPADIRLTKAVRAMADESALTGESVPVRKDAGFTAGESLPIGDRKNMAFSSTYLVYGRAEGIVTATGMDTEIGMIAQGLNQGKREMTPLQKRLADLGKWLSIAAVGLCASLFALAILQKRDLFDMFLTAISLAVAAVPEGLPAIVTIVLALSVSRMVKVHTIVRKLPSVETLGCVSVICSDKTGTLTQNKMRVVACYMDGQTFEPKTMDRKTHARLAEGFLLCNDSLLDSETVIGDPTELALLELGDSIGISKKELEKKYPRVDEIPFDSERKRMTTIHRNGNGMRTYVKGSGDVLLQRCTRIVWGGNIVPIQASHKTAVRQAMDTMAKQALRVLALAMDEGNNKTEEDLIFVGLAGMMDPPRPEAAKAIQIFKKASVKTVMITGDHVDTAFAIARQLGIAEEMGACMTGRELDDLSDGELQNRIGSITVFARVSPSHKTRIVKAFQNRGEIVAMTGDGVNDAPSLKAADIGIAMGKGGTDVAKNAADLVLTDDNFATIEKAMEEGRGIYENIKKTVIFLLSSNFGEIITMFFAIAAGLASPLKAGHILWINLITDTLPALALGTDQNDGELLMEEAPRSPKESLFSGNGLFCTLFYGCIIGGISLIAFLTIPIVHMLGAGDGWQWKTIGAMFADPVLLERSQTYAFTVLGLSQLFHAVGMREVTVSVFMGKQKKNLLLIAAFAVGIGLQVAVTEIPFLIQVFHTVRLTVGEWIGLLFLSSVPLWAHEGLCFGMRKRKSD